MAAFFETSDGGCLQGEAKKKHRKRQNKKQSASQPASKPIRDIDGPPRPKNVQWRTHIMGAPMLSKEMLAVATRDMRSLHDSMLVLEDRILKDRSAGYPAFVAKLPGARASWWNQLGRTC